MNVGLRFVAAMAAVATLLEAGTSSANGRFPATGAIALSATDPNVLVGRSTYGFLISKDRGVNWDWVCEMSVGFNGPEDPMIALLSGNAMAATLASGLVVSKDVGCSWQYAPDAVPRDLFIDIAARKSDSRIAVAISSKYAGATTDAGQLLFRSELFTTADAGTTWAKVGQAFDPTLLLETVDVAESDPRRLYVSAIRGSGPDLQGFLLVSDDFGVTWQSRSVPLVLNEDRAPFIGAISPTDANTLYVRTSATPGKPNRLLVSTDAGRNWQVKHQTTGAMLGFALSPDGSKVFLGSQEDGLWSADATTLSFAKKSSVQVQCLAVSAEGVWACSNEISGFVFGFSKDDGATFEPRLRLSGLRGPLECPVGSTTYDKCVPDWPRQRAELGIVTVDAGAAGDAGQVGDAGTSPAPSNGSKCGCDVGSGSVGGALAALLASFGVTLRRRAAAQKRRRAASR